MTPRRSRTPEEGVGLANDGASEEVPTPEAAADAIAPQALTDEQIEEIVTLLRAGRRLPPHLFPHLFETPREYQLAYRGKARSIDILADTMAVPLQPVRTFGAPLNGWSNMLIFGDNLQVLRQLLNMKETGQLRNADGTDGVRVCYIDPPFATDREFQGALGQAAYSDRVAGAEFIEALRRRLILIRELLAEDGTLYVHLDWKKGHYVKVILDEIFGPSHFRNELIWWYYNKLQGNINRFPSNHDVIYVYGKSANTVFHPIMEQRDELARFIQRVWDPRTKKLVNAKDSDGRVLYVDRQDRRVDDVWRLSMLQPADRTEKVDFPTQKPETLVSLAIAAASNDGDIVMDAFAGSGTAAVVAQRLGRRWIAIDSGKFPIYVTQSRLLKRAAKTERIEPFTLFNAGLYDYSTLRELPRDEYVDFVLDLFQCRKSRQDIAGVTFQGFIADDPVLVYDFAALPGAQIGHEFVDDLAGICRGRLGRRCFIIAPASAVAPYEDYLTVGDTRFFFLRIPYSIIAELHKKAFRDLRQPTSGARTNALIDSIGFDFIQPPRVECRYTADADNLYVRVISFESEAFAAASSEENIADLAMVLVDYDYDGEVFALRAVHFSEDLARDAWQLAIPHQEVGERVMLIYIDLYGNEHREVRSVESFSPPATPRKSRQRKVRSPVPVKALAPEKGAESGTAVERRSSKGGVAEPVPTVRRKRAAPNTQASTENVAGGGASTRSARPGRGNEPQ